MRLIGPRILSLLFGNILQVKQFKGFRDLPGQKLPLKKKVVGPGVGTNRMRRVREGKNW